MDCERDDLEKDSEQVFPRASQTQMGAKVVFFCMKTCILEFSLGLTTIYMFCGTMFRV